MSEPPWRQFARVWRRHVIGSPQEEQVVLWARIYWLLALAVASALGVLAAACRSEAGSQPTVTPAVSAATSTVTAVATRVRSTPPPDATLNPTTGLHPTPREFVVDQGVRTLAVDIRTGTTRPILTIPQALLESAGGRGVWSSELHTYAASPDGTRVAFPCRDYAADPVPLGPASAICVLESGHDAVERVATLDALERPGWIDRPCCAADPFSWSPDGQRFVFQASIGDPNAEGHGDDVYLEDLRAGTSRRLIESGPHERWTGAKWSPDGSHFALQSMIGADITNLIVVDTASGQQVDLVTSIPDRVIVEREFSWSPDSTAIAFVARNPDDPVADSHVYVASVDGSEVRAIAFGVARGYSTLLWSPDGRWITALLLDGRTPQGYDVSRLYAIRSDGAGARALGRNIVTHAAAGWAQDSAHVAVWTCQRLMVVDVDGGPNGPASAFAACGALTNTFVWDLDGSRFFVSLIFCGQGGCTYERLFVLDIGRGEPRPIDDLPVYRFLGYR